MSFIQFIDEIKKYKVGDTEILANNNISFEIEEGELVIIVGASGAGKSTVLNIMGGMDKCDSGQVIIDNKDIAKYSERELTKFRRFEIGFVFQFYNLIPNLTVLENVELASQISKSNIDPLKIISDVGLDHRINNFPAQLSGGEQQRVAIARALAKDPKILLCDEPTGALDYNTGKSILKLLQNISRENNKTVVIITHNSLIKPMADRIIEINDAKVRSIKINDKPVSIDDIEW